MNRGRRRHRCRGNAESCPWPGAEQGETQRSCVLGTADNSTRMRETDDYRRQGSERRHAERQSRMAEALSLSDRRSGFRST